jgi:hypothetical protein
VQAAFAFEAQLGLKAAEHGFRNSADPCKSNYIDMLGEMYAPIRAYHDGW